MFYGNNIQDTRPVFFSSWRKHNAGRSLSPLEQQLVAVIELHPEYHAFLETASPQDDPSAFLAPGESNPFFHIGLHLALRDQIATNRPSGITEIFSHLLQKHSDTLLVEHLMMQHLAQSLIQAQKTQKMPDEQAYLAACRKLLA